MQSTVEGGNTSLRMLRLDVKHRWVFAAILFYGIFVVYESSDTNDTRRQKNVQFVSVRNITVFPSKAVYYEVNGPKLCFTVLGNNLSDCGLDFNYSFQMRGHEKNYSLILDEETLSTQDIILMTVGDMKDSNCMPSKLYNATSVTGFLSNIRRCLNMGDNIITLSHNGFCGNSSPYDEDTCKGLTETQYKLTVINNKSHCVSCKPPPGIPPESNNRNPTKLDEARNIMNNFSYLTKDLGNSSTATIRKGSIQGVITKLLNDTDNIMFGITASGDVNILEGNNAVMKFPRVVRIPAEAIEKATERNGSFAAVVLFPEMHQDGSNCSFLNNEVLGIEMGAEISNLSHTIDIQYRNVDKNGRNVSCRSWDAKGKEAIWITDGCQTNETDDSITCQCSHLTFFAILLSPPPGNISASDFKSLTYITSVGCGLSIFFLMVALFMYCFIRKGKASQATKILMNLFVAMLALNLSFLVNESIAKLGNFGACVVVAAILHYSVLATFTWFFIEALHLYLHLRKLPTDIKHYMMKICITGWVTPAVAVIALLALSQYDYIVIYTDDGNSAKMCWLSNAVVHQGVNIGYYAAVFIFTVFIFGMTVWKIGLLGTKFGKASNSSIKINSFSIVSLFLLLGITWAFAFFSYGPLLIPSYYIFTILNSFQGFFLFIYYFNTSKIVREDSSTSATNSSTAVSNTVVTAHY